MATCFVPPYLKKCGCHFKKKRKDFIDVAVVDSTKQSPTNVIVLLFSKTTAVGKHRWALGSHKCCGTFRILCIDIV